MDYYKINGVVMPPFDEIEPETHNLYGSNTGRDESGYNHLDLIRPNIRKWKIKHRMLTRRQIDEIKNALNPLGFTATVPHTNGMVTATCYGNITEITLVHYEDDTPNGSFWDCVVTIIEN